MPDKILLVDDEPAVLQGLQRLLRDDFDTETAVEGKGALILLENNGPYAVVVSDMRMPHMDGAELLAKIKLRAPETVRIMLTGNADIQAAVKAVNEGSIFRFLTKPCEKELLATTLTAALVQYRLIVAEKQLLEQTLKGSVEVLTEVLSLVSPAAFSRAARARRYVRHIVTRLALGNPWKFEVAAMMSQLGCVALDPAIIDGVYSGRKLSPEEQAFDSLLHKGLSRTEAASRLSRQSRDLDPRIFAALVELDPEVADKQIRSLPISGLVPGMIIEQEIRNRGGSLLVASGQEVTTPLLLKLKGLWEAKAIDESVPVSSPKGWASSQVTS